MIILLIITVVIAIVALFLAIWALSRTSYPIVHHRTRIIHHHSDDDVPTPTPEPVEPDFDGLTDNLITAAGTDPRLDGCEGVPFRQSTGKSGSIAGCEHLVPYWTRNGAPPPSAGDLWSL